MSYDKENKMTKRKLPRSKKKRIIKKWGRRTGCWPCIMIKKIDGVFWHRVDGLKLLE